MWVPSNPSAFLSLHLTTLISGRGLKGSRRNLLLATAAMYISTAVSWIALLLGQFQSLDQIKGDLLYEFPSGYVWPVLESYVGSTALAINVRGTLSFENF